MREIAHRIRALAAPALLWIWLCWHLHFEWTLNAQYNYGWAVPFLAAFLFWLRWADRASAGPPSRAVSTAAGMCILLALLLPIRAIEEANPDWRLLSWTLALVVVGYTLLALFRTGGGAWVAHFVFPVCFPLVAVPWPVQFENVIVQGLTRAVAYVAVEVAGWIGVGAFQLGNVIELHNGFVGVDEACSGVKTLQAAIMVTLVLGELLQLRARRRFLLLAGGCVWMFACNVLRATSLVIIAARQGTDALHRWHDLIGTAGLIAGMAGLLALAWLIRSNENATGLSAPIVQRGQQNRLTTPSRPFLTALALGWLVAIFVATELWYRAHERDLITRPLWEANWPSGNGTRQETPIADTTQAILRYDRATSAAWQEQRSLTWWGFFARWEPRRAALQLVRSHSPEICLPAAGRIFRGELAPITIETELLRLSFRAFAFEQNHRPLFVYVCIQEDKLAPGETAAAAGFNARSRLLAAWHGKRNLGQRLLELAVMGADDARGASEALARTVRATVAAPTG